MEAVIHGSETIRIVVTAVVVVVIIDVTAAVIGWEIIHKSADVAPILVQAAQICSITTIVATVSGVRSTRIVVAQIVEYGVHEVSCGQIGMA